MPEEKFNDLIGVKCHQRMRAALKRIAAARGLDDTDLLRAAGLAIVEFAVLYGDAAAAELAVNLGQKFVTVNEVLHVAEKAAEMKEKSPPAMLPSLPESPPPEAGKRGKKSPRKRGPE